MGLGLGFGSGLYLNLILLQIQHGRQGLAFLKRPIGFLLKECLQDPQLFCAEHRARPPPALPRGARGQPEAWQKGERASEELQGLSPAQRAWATHTGEQVGASGLRAGGGGKQGLCVGAWHVAQGPRPGTCPPGPPAALGLGVRISQKSLGPAPVFFFPGPRARQGGALRLTQASPPAALTPPVSSHPPKRTKPDREAGLGLDAQGSPSPTTGSHLRFPGPHGGPRLTAGRPGFLHPGCCWALCV